MKKSIILIAIVAAALLIGAPYFTGKAAEAETRKLIDTINLSQAEYGKTEVVSYERGMRSTRAKYRYTLPTAFQTFAPDLKHVDYICDSQHGVTGIDYQCVLEGETAYGKFVQEHLNGNNPVSVYGEISAFGGFTQTIELEEIENLNIEGETFSLPSAKIAVESNNEFSHLKVRGGSDAFDFESKDEALGLGKTSISADLTRVQGSIFVGSMNMSLDSLKARDSSGTATMNKLELTSNTSVKGDNIDTQAALKIKSMTMPQEPIKAIEDVNYHIALNGLDMQAMADYQAYAQTLQRDMLLALENKREPQADPAQMMELIAILERMLKKDLHLKNNVSANVDGKPNNFSVDLKLLEDSSMSQLAVFLQNPEQALSQFDASISTSINKGLIDAQPGIAQLISQSPIVSAKKDVYSIDLKLGKEIKLNGKTVSFQELQYAVLSSLPF